MRIKISRTPPATRLIAGAARALNGKGNFWKVDLEAWLRQPARQEDGAHQSRLH